MSRAQDPAAALFRIGNGVGPFGRWFRLFAGLNTVLYLSVNPILLNPMPAGELWPHFAKVATWLVVIVAAYMAGVWLFGRLVFSRLNPWAGTAIFLGVPTLLSLLGLVPVAFQIAFGFYVGGSLITTFFMRYGGCEVVALPSLLMGRRYTMYCPYNAIDAVERAVTLDRFSTRGRSVAILSLAITFFIGGYFLVERIGRFFGRFGLAFELDDRLAWLLFIPAGYLLFMTVESYARERRLLAAPVRKFGLGGAVLTLLTISLVAPPDPYMLWLVTLAAGTLFVIGELVTTASRRWRAGRFD